MFLLYHSDRCNTSEIVFHWCYVNDLHTTHAVVCWVTTGFFHRGDFLGEGAPSGGGPGGLTMGGRGQGRGRAPLWCGWPLDPLHLIFSLCEASVKIEGLAFVSSNSENISCVTFLKHKNNRK
jgi:hypothetical protein